MRKPIFQRGLSLETRLFYGILASILLLVADGMLGRMQDVRSVVQTVVAPVQFAATLPATLLEISAKRIDSQEKLLQEKQALVNTVLALQAENQRYQTLATENQQLRALLEAPLRVELAKTIAQVITAEMNPYEHRLKINKGSLQNVHINQPVIDDQGIVGQVVDTALNTSSLLLITDLAHAIPVRVLRNNLTFIASGTGRLDRLQLEHVPLTADLQVGDTLISSGLGRVFPAGYPVGTITAIDYADYLPFAEVTVTPSAKLDRLKYILLLGGVDGSAH